MTVPVVIGESGLQSPLDDDSPLLQQSLTTKKCYAASVVFQVCLINLNFFLNYCDDYSRFVYKAIQKEKL